MKKTMTITIKMFFIAIAILSVMFIGSVETQADPSLNGIGLNGLMLNGVDSSGLHLNGIILAGE